MIKRKLIIGALLILAAAAGGCSSIVPKTAPSETTAQKYGSYCEQLGNVKGTPEYEKCIKTQEDIYR